MADIELIVKLPEEIRLALINNIHLSIDQQSICDSYIKQAIRTGTPLSKGHGRILDEKDILDIENNDGGWYDLVDMPEYIAGVKPIIEADKAESEDDMAKIKWSKGPEEWYCSYGKCCNCNTEFMCSKAHYCPGCGEKIEEGELINEDFVDAFEEFTKKLFKQGQSESEDKELRPVNPQPKTGYWIKRPNGFKCSKCLIVHSHTSIYCPSCGAKMIESPELLTEIEGVPKEKLDESEYLYQYFMKKNFGIDESEDEK